MTQKKLNPMTRLRRLLLEARDEIYGSVTAAGWDKASTEPALVVRIQLIRRIDRALTESLTDEELNK